MGDLTTIIPDVTTTPTQTTSYPTPTMTETVTPMHTTTGYPIPTMTETVTPMHTTTGYPTPTMTETVTPMHTTTGYPTPTMTETVTPMHTTTGYPTSTPTMTVTVTPTDTTTGYPTSTPTMTETVTPTDTTTGYPTSTPTMTETVTHTPTMSGTPYTTPGETVTPTIIYQGTIDEYNGLSVFIDYDCTNTLYGSANRIDNDCFYDVINGQYLNEGNIISGVNYVSLAVIDVMNENAFSIYSEQGDIISPLENAYIRYNKGNIEIRPYYGESRYIFYGCNNITIKEATNSTVMPTVTVTVTPTDTTTGYPTSTVTMTETVTPTYTTTGTTPSGTPGGTPGITPTETVTPTDTPTMSGTPSGTPTETVTPTDTPSVPPEVLVTWVVYYPSGTTKVYYNTTNDSFRVYGADTYDTLICENCYYYTINGNYIVYRGAQSSLSEPRVITLRYIDKGTTIEPSVTPTGSSTVTGTPDPSTAVSDSPTRFIVNSKPILIKYTGKQSINVKIGSIYSASSAYVIPRYYHKSNKFGVFTDNNNSTIDDFRYFNIMKTVDNNINDATAYSYNISLKTSPNLYPIYNNETISGTSNEIPNTYKSKYKQWTYTWNSIRILPNLINNGTNANISCGVLDTSVFEVRQKQNNITLPQSHNISFYGNTTLKEYQIGPVVIEPINSYSDTVIAKITKVSSNNILSFSNGASSVSIKRGEQISVKRNTTSSSGWAYVTITSGDILLTPPFTNPISYTCIVNLNYLGSQPSGSGSGSDSGSGSGGNNNDVINPTPSGSDIITPTPSSTPSGGPTPSSSPGESGQWIEIDGTRYYGDATHSTNASSGPESVTITCSSDVTYEKEKSDVGDLYYIYVKSINSGQLLFTVTLGDTHIV